MKQSVTIFGHKKKDRVFGMEKVKKIHGVRNETCAGDRNEIGQEFVMANTGRS